MSLIDADDQVTLAIYAHSKNLLDTVGWKKYKKLYDREKKLLRIINQAKLKSYRSSPVYKYGFEVPRDHAHAMDLDRKNGNTKWHDAEPFFLIITMISLTMLASFSTSFLPLPSLQTLVCFIVVDRRGFKIPLPFSRSSRNI